MASHRLRFLSLFFSFLVTTSFAISSRDDTDTPEASAAFNEFGFTKGAAIGDSYAAGLGAGNEVDGEDKCFRFDESYSSFVGAAFWGIDFTYSACSGALIKGATKQARALSSDQNFIIISAGGNDAQLKELLNGCVYRFLGLAAGDHGIFLQPPDCDAKLEEVSNAIENGDFDLKLDELLDVARGKLAADGNIYYVGYARFFDASDEACDEVSWHLWGIAGVKTLLTQERRRAMNNVVDAMNDVLKLAVQRAGPQVHFIDYDKYVGMTDGRFCEPGVDESKGHGANRPDSFFYQMMSEEGAPEKPDNIENAKRDEEAPMLVNGTAGDAYGAWIHATLEESDAKMELNPDNANADLIDMVEEMRTQITNSGSNARFKVTSGNKSSNNTVFTTASAPKMRIAEEDVKMGDEIPVSVARVFHPTPGGHELIANLILYKMEAVRAGDSAFAEIVDSVGGDLPHVESVSCNGDSTATWADRDTIISNIYDFCAHPWNLQGKQGELTSSTFNSGTFDYLNISISWDTDGAIGEHACRAWLDAVTDGCDVPNDDGENSSNLKHGGAVEYQNVNANATLRIQPLTVRRIWNDGRTENCTATDHWEGDDKIQRQDIRRRELTAFCEGDALREQEDNDRDFADPGSRFSRKMDVSPLDGAMQLQIEWPHGEQAYQIFPSECVYFFSQLINDCEEPKNGYTNWNFRSAGSLYAKSGVKYSVEFLQGAEPDDIPTDMLQHPIKVIVPANITSNGTSGDSAREMTLGGLMNITST